LGKLLDREKDKKRQYDAELTILSLTRVRDLIVCVRGTARLLAIILYMLVAQ
jgi:hypothetical protein